MRIGNEGGFSCATVRANTLVGSFMNQSDSRNFVCRFLLVVFFGGVTVMSSGCSTMTSMTSKPLPVDREMADSSYGTFAVEVHSNFGSPRQYKGQLNGTKTISDALTEAKAVKRYQTLDIEVLRVVEKNGKSRGLRMPVDFDPQASGPSPEQDYALLDGDRIVVKPKQAGGLVKMLSAVMGSR